MFWVKICGISTPEAALCAAENGASAVGFILSPGFRRTVSPELAREIITRLPADLHKVGVFVGELPKRVAELVRFCGLTLVQLHGSEPPNEIDVMPVPVIKSLRLLSPDDAVAANGYRRAQMLLIEPLVAGQAGGTGTALDPTLFQAARQQLQTPGAQPRLILAGGLTPENIAATIAAAGPDGVDVSSGVETAGSKDGRKIADFIAAARAAALAPDRRDGGRTA